MSEPEIKNLFFSAKQAVKAGYCIGLLEDGREVAYTEMCGDENVKDGKPANSGWDDNVFLGKGSYLRGAIETKSVYSKNFHNY